MYQYCLFAFWCVKAEPGLPLQKRYFSLILTVLKVAVRKIDIPGIYHYKALILSNLRNVETSIETSFDSDKEGNL